MSILQKYLLMVLLGLVGLTRPVGAAVLHVPSPYATINAALDASVAGDSVLVAPGVYNQYETRLLGDGNWFSSVAFLKGDVAVVAGAGAELTTLRLDSTPEAPRLCRAFGESGTAQVVGFTMTGSAPGLIGVSFTNGGRLVLRDCEFRDLGTGMSGEVAAGTVRADMEVYNCRFENINGAVGSAINQTSGTLIAEDCEFLNCRYGAVRLQFDSGFPHATGLTMRRCRFVGNQGGTNSSLGGVFVNGYSTVLIEDSWFEANQAYAGAGITTGGTASSQVIRGNTFVSNVAEYTAGVRAHAGSLQVIGNTFWNNNSSRGTAEGGSCIFFESAAELRNNVIAGSSGDEAVGYFTSPPQTSCNVFFANSPGNATFPLSATDLPADPMFCDAAAKDFTVNVASPCLPENGHPSCTEQIGAWGQGCGTVSLDPASWGKLKSNFRLEGEVER